MTSTNFTQGTLESPTGARLNCYRSKTRKKPNAIIQINHGMAEHGARYQRFMAALAKAGYHSVVHDHRGHGSTEADDAPLGSFGNADGWQKVLDDVSAVHADIRSTYPGVPVVCFGHSMGATIAASWTLNTDKPADALAAWNGSCTGFLPSMLVFMLKIERMFKGSDTASSLAAALTFDAWNKSFKPNRTEFDWLSRDHQEVDKYVADPLCGFACTNGLWLDLLGGLNGLADRERIVRLPKSLPVHLLAGAEDPCSSKGQAVTQFSARLMQAGLTDVTAINLPGTRHESLNEINRDETTGNFIKWLDERFAC